MKPARAVLLTGDRDPERTVRELLEQGIVDARFKKPRADGLVEAIRRVKARPAPTRE